MNPSTIDFRQFFRHFKTNILNKPDTRYRTHKARATYIIGHILIYPVYALVHWSFLLLDELFYPQMRNKPVEKPLFIIGSYRSGTTFIQRLLAMDRKSFASTTTWELVFAPSILGRKFIRGAIVVDRIFGGPVSAIMAAIGRFFSREDSAHKMGMDQHEEDETLFLHIYSTQFIYFVNPFMEEGRKYFFYDQMVHAHQRKQEMRFYRGCIQRHMFSHPESAFYLCKNPAHTSRVESLLGEFPDAKFLYMLRNPLDVIPSLMHWFSQVWETLEKPGCAYPYADLVIDFVYDWYTRTISWLETMPDEMVKILPYTDLVADPAAAVADVYRWYGRDLAPEFEEKLRLERRKAKTGWKARVHRFEEYGLDAKALDARFAEVLDRYDFPRINAHLEEPSGFE